MIQPPGRLCRLLDGLGHLSPADKQDLFDCNEALADRGGCAGLLMMSHRPGFERLHASDPFGYRIGVGRGSERLFRDAHSPFDPSMSSRTMSMCPRCRADSCRTSTSSRPARFGSP